MTNENNTKMKYTEPTNTNTFTLKNFRSFDAEGAEFQISPITILTGCNSAGKSSLVKGMALLSDMLKGVDINNLIDGKINFAYSNPKYGLGSFASVLNNKAGEHGEIELGYSYFSYFTQKQMRVEFSFRNDSTDNSGKLSGFRLFVENEIVLNVNAQIMDAEWGMNAFWKLAESNFEILRESLFLPAISYYWNNLVVEKEILEDVIPKHDKKELNEAIQMINEGMTNILSLIAANGISRTEFEKAIQISKQFKEVHFFDPKSEKRSAFHKNINRSILTFGKLGVLYYTPLLDEIGEFNPKEVHDWFEQHLDFEDSERKQKIQNFIEEFAKSGIEKFVDFYRSKEALYIIVFHRFEDTPLTFSSSHPILTNMFPSNDDDFEALLAFTIDKYWDTIVRDSTHFSIKETPSVLGPTLSFSLANLFASYLDFILCEALTPSFLWDTQYIGSTSVAVKRMYSWEQYNDPLVQLFKQYSDRRNSAKNYYGIYSSGSFVNHWLKEFEIADRFEFKNTEDGAGFTTKLIKDGKEVYIADEGYGISQLVSLLLHIDIAIANNRVHRDYDAKKNEEIFIRGQKILTIEEPEIHLHPALQSKLADMFLDAYEKYNIRFIIETHSEYLIRESQVLVSQMGFETSKDSDSKAPFRTYYIPKDGKPYSLGYRKDGRFAEKFGDGFYNESTILTNKML